MYLSSTKVLFGQALSGGSSLIGMCIGRIAAMLMALFHPLQSRAELESIDSNSNLERDFRAGFPWTNYWKTAAFSM